MAKTIFENMGGTYAKVGEYFLPNLKLPEEAQPIGVWGQRHLQYIKQYRKSFYSALLLKGELYSYIAGIDEEATEMFSLLVKQIAEREGVTEQLKADSPLEWVRRMNNIRERSSEIVNAEVIYA